MFEQPAWRRSTWLDKVVPPPRLLHPLLPAVVQVSHQGVALVLVIRVETGVGYRLQVVLLLGIGSLDQDEVHPASRAHALREAHFFHSLGVSRGRGTHHVDPWGQEAEVLAIFTWEEGAEVWNQRSDSLCSLLLWDRDVSPEVMLCCTPLTDIRAPWIPFPASSFTMPLMPRWAWQTHATSCFRRSAAAPPRNASRTDSPLPQTPAELLGFRSSLYTALLPGETCRSPAPQSPRNSWCEGSWSLACLLIRPDGEDGCLWCHGALSRLRRVSEPTAWNAEPLRPVNGAFLTVGPRGSTPGALQGHGFMGVCISTGEKLENLWVKQR